MSETTPSSQEPPYDSPQSLKIYKNTPQYILMPHTTEYERPMKLRTLRLHMSEELCKHYSSHLYFVVVSHSHFCYSHYTLPEFKQFERWYSRVDLFLEQNSVLCQVCLLKSQLALRLLCVFYA